MVYHMLGNMHEYNDSVNGAIVWWCACIWKKTGQKIGYAHILTFYTCTMACYFLANVHILLL